jgi:hypothetical protein
MDVSLFGTCSHVIIMTQKVDPRAEGGARIFINEISIKVIEMLEMCQALGKARLLSEMKLLENYQEISLTCIGIL